MMATANHEQVAFLVLAHQEPDHLARLLRRIDVPWAQTFVHIDAKSDEAPFRAASSDLARVIWLGGVDRVQVEWGTFSQAQAMLNLINAALLRPNVSRIAMLTGADYPTKPLPQIRDQLLRSGEFIRIDRRLDASGRRPQDGHLRGSTLLSRIQSQFRRDPPLAVFHGSAMFSITRPAARIVVDYYKRNPKILRYFRDKKSVDEMIFHTGLKACEVVVAQDGLDRLLDRTTHGIHFIDWGDGGAHPRVLVEADLPALQKSSALFGRKFDPNLSAGLLRIIDDQIHEVLSN